MLAVEGTSMNKARFRKRLVERIDELNNLRAHDDYQEVADLCCRVVRQAGDHAAALGLPVAVSKCSLKRPTLTEARECLAFCLLQLEDNAPRSDNPTDAPLTVKQASERYGIPTRTLYALCKDGLLAHVRVGTGRGTIRIEPADLDRHLQQNRVEVQSAEDLIFGSPG